MSQRLIKNIPGSKARISDHVIGQALYELRGASPLDDENDDTDSSEGQDDENGGGGSGTESSGKENDGGNKDEESLEALRNRMKAADRRASAAEARAKALEDEKLSDDQRKVKELEELRAYRQQAEAEQSALKAQIAFLSINDISWQDPSIALGQLDFTELVDEDGAIDKAALRKAVKKLAEEKPFLVKSTSGTTGGGTGTPGPSGGGVGSSKGSKKGDPFSEEELRRRYPALNV